MLSDELFYIVGHGQIFVSRIVRRVAMIPQILSVFSTKV